uniref:Histidine kinase-, DNA gyrase B-, and HSP90-like ATPase n=1 Tax=Candidatus Kentrum sp. FM TaxID=2126340 RepID=A0A450T0V1_9GAMM|nr:MAG: Histidine kinase-, DNA gyrase B-, and HSP90-like ATPase [Candidatus Kentron sp. FM]VFJ60709.1 MAG: Histidine kinase-, DNA gyrase B-, and HSP90-like ATPase [Candidatus Kentron sp. FM]VFK13290.1 MAG: Histidine kinase-, DNA gyrase B-, and HSP90-like ATPase [Candidatus Kentron sp. FM]
MNKQTHRVEVKADHLSKLTRSDPVKALAELIWNGLDADATRVDVTFGKGTLGTDKVIVSDNGIGFPMNNAVSFFGALGGSWKSREGKTDEGRYLHGKEGRGRFKAFSLGRYVEWKVRPRSDSKAPEKPFLLTAKVDSLEQFSTEEIQQDNSGSDRGVIVTVSELHSELKIFEPEVAVSKLLPIFCLYLRNYSDIVISIGGIQLDPVNATRTSHTKNLDMVPHEGKEHTVELEIVEWNDLKDKELWYCTPDGFPLQKYDRQIRSIGDFGFSAYLKSALLSVLDKENRIGLGDLDPVLRDITESAVTAIKEHFSRRAIEEGQAQIRQWKSENVYPFVNEPATPVETAERQVFDIVAVDLSEKLPSLKQSDKQSKAFQLKMLRLAVENSPEDLQTVIAEVLNLPREKIEQLSELLRDVSLVGIINASKLVANRLDFLKGLEHLLFDSESKKNLKERSQLHRIIAENTWLFGHEFSVSVDDRSLTEVLRKHRELKKLDIPIDEPVRRIDGSTGIVDLMLSRAIPSRYEDEIEHLVIELKRPKVKIGESECSQIKNYALAVTRDERFRSLSATWNFWVISNEMDEYAMYESNQDGRPLGIIQQSSRDRIKSTIWVKTWSQIIKENKHRLQFIQDKLDYSVGQEDALRYLRETYAKFTEGVIVDSDLSG